MGQTWKMLGGEEDARFGSELGDDAGSPARWVQATICSRCRLETCVCTPGLCVSVIALMVGTGRGPADPPELEIPGEMDSPGFSPCSTPTNPAATLLSMMQNAPRKKGVPSVEPSAGLVRRSREVAAAIGAAFHEPPALPFTAAHLRDGAIQSQSDEMPTKKNTVRAHDDPSHPRFKSTFSASRGLFQSPVLLSGKGRPLTPSPDHDKNLAKKPRLPVCDFFTFGEEDPNSLICAKCGFLYKDHRAQEASVFI
jgi:hypothetical protein